MLSLTEIKTIFFGRWQSDFNFETPSINDSFLFCWTDQGQWSSRLSLAVTEKNNDCLHAPQAEGWKWDITILLFHSFWILFIWCATKYLLCQNINKNVLCYCFSLNFSLELYSRILHFVLTWFFFIETQKYATCHVLEDIV